MTDLNDPSIFDYAKPYNIMVGVWTGMANVFDPRGGFIPPAQPSSVAVYWRDAKSLIFNQFQPTNDDSAHGADVLHVHRGDFRETIIRSTILFTVDGKGATGVSVPEGSATVIGTESMPGIYLFQFTVLDGKGGTVGTYFNNQYFLDPSQRNIVGPYLPNGHTNAAEVIVQTFNRISYTVPAELKLPDDR